MPNTKNEKCFNKYYQYIDCFSHIIYNNNKDWNKYKQIDKSWILDNEFVI